ncbi:hypothetical protein COHA_004200 [Chlorella ohadii]|uniref:Uncharacterized protein n=1 Tax=Chlorella ohadii TaxID=2649997 RepID=A0AAD5H2V3_9CHLO|nr:hypothetical protein COHA_004200 [Chlorella ohadii]
MDSTDAATSNGGENQSYTLLRHPSGSPVYVVGTAHVSQKAVQDVVSLIQRVSPAVIVLELDPQREHKLLEQAEEGDTYGVKKFRDKSSWQIVKMSFTGEALSYFMSSIYTITVVLGDRDQNTTLARLQYYTRYLTQRDSRRQSDERKLRRMMDATSGQGRPIDTPTDTALDRTLASTSRDGPTPKERQVAAEVAAEAANPEDPWGLGPDDNTEAGMRRRLLEMMREGGCPRPNEVLSAAKRLFQDGMDSSASIRPVDILTVRQCGNSLVETFRQRALKGDDTWMQRLEREQVAGAKGAAGMERSNTAMQKVIVDERDLILARRLWEAGQEAGTQPVVGVVGAGHIRGIARDWARAGDPETEELVNKYLQVPKQDEASPYLTGAVTAAVLGTIAYRRPKALAIFAGMVALMTAPYLGFMVVTVNRFGRFADKLVRTVDTMDASGSSGFESGGWAAEGGGADEWQ